MERPFFLVENFLGFFFQKIFNPRFIMINMLIYCISLGLLVNANCYFIFS